MHFKVIITSLAFVITVPAAFALYKLQPESGTLVENAKTNMAYLFQFPRTSTTPSQAALNLKVETWLKWARIPFHRISNQFFLGSRSTGAAPFALYNGKFIDGSDNIIEVLGKASYKYKADNEETKLRNEIDNKLFKILMLDRATRDANDVGGLDWMLKDEGIAAQMVPPLFADGKTVFSVKLADGNEYQLALNVNSLNAYFNVYSFTLPEYKGAYNPLGECRANVYREACQKAKTDFMEKFLVAPNKNTAPTNFTFNDWVEFNNAIRQKVIVPALQKIFKQKQSGPSSSEAKLDQLIEKNKQISTLKGNEKEILKAVKSVLNPLVSKLRSRELFERVTSVFKRQESKTTFLLSNELSPADASLFGVLVQFFETPLNTDSLRAYFQGEGEKEKNVEIMEAYVKLVKQSLGLNEIDWNDMTIKPWTLNYEEGWPSYGHDIRVKYDGPYKLEAAVDELEGIQQVLNADGSVNQAVLQQYPGSVQAAVQKMIDYVENTWSNDPFVLEDSVKFEAKTHKMKLFLLKAISAYICITNYADKEEPLKTEECELKHLKDLFDEHQKYERQKIFFWNNLHVARKLAYEAIVEYNDGLVKKNVLAAVAVAKAKGEIATSPAEIGNEQ